MSHAVLGFERIASIVNSWRMGERMAERIEL